MREVIVGKTYKHFKGHIVKVLCIAKNTETLEKEVVYQHLGSSDIWARPYDMFNSLVDKNKYPDVTQKYRFEEIDE